MKELRIMVIGAHPDDCDGGAGGVAMKYRRLGHKVMFLSATNGCSGHMDEEPVEILARRYAETRRVAELSGIEYKMLDNTDGYLTTDIHTREMIIREIRNFKPDMIFTHRSNDYHPDHRNTGLLVQDASYMVMVPNVLPDCPVLRYNPVVCYMNDSFTFPCPFVPDVVVDIDDAMKEKTDICDCHVSQYYEWLPWVDGYLDQVPPADQPEARWQFLNERFTQRNNRVATRFREQLKERYGEERGEKVVCAEAFQVCEYGAHPSKERLAELFPF